jgi:hypothetical protein
MSMSSGTLEQLVRETIEVTGATLPSLMEKDAPVLDRTAISPSDDGGFYLVGIIGGKEVGKSALVNALAGEAVTVSTSFGPGTEQAIAYAHASQEGAVAKLLESIVPGKFRVVKHQVADLRGLVLLDLPDIDSHYQDHLATTRAVLRHLLFPVWVGSVEKYADQQPMRLLAQVAAGNAPENFVFVLNKGDQLAQERHEGTEGRRHEGEERESAKAQSEDDAVPAGSSSLRASVPSSLPASPPSLSREALELRADYARRIRSALQMGNDPRVFVISAISPAKFELPELRKVLMRAKGEAAVKESKELALRRQENSLLRWLGTQQLPVRAARLSRLREEAEELLGSRLGPALLERMTPRLANDSLARLAIADDVLEERVARWPIVNLVHTFFSPLLVMARGMTSRQAVSPGNADSVVDACLRETDEPVATLVQSAFGQLRRSQPIVGELYVANVLWEAGPADAAAADLSRRLAQTLLRQRTAVRERLAGRGAWVGAPIRWLLTIGAILWFPFVQPILSMALAQNLSITKLATAALLIQVLGVDYLLKSAVFLFIWFLVLWLALRWNTQRKVARLVKKWAATDLAEPAVNLTTQSMQWMDGLLAPIQQAEQRALSLAQRVEEFASPGRRAG